MTIGLRFVNMVCSPCSRWLNTVPNYLNLAQATALLHYRSRHACSFKL
jgi:hypothetical protein